MNRILLTGLLAATVLTSACGTKRHASQLPPPPPAQGASPSDPYAGAGNGASATASGAAQRGSQADLVATAGADRVLFEFDAFEIDAAGRAVLTRQAVWLRDNPQARITIEGHCDERGTREYNIALGERRANSVKNFLAAQGVAVARMSTISYGKERPEVQGSDDESYAANRRAVSIVVGG